VTPFSRVCRPSRCLGDALNWTEDRELADVVGELDPCLAQYKDWEEGLKEEMDG
jgi:hypothetical protein